MKRRSTAAALSLAAAAVAATYAVAIGADARKPNYGAWGVDLTSRDTSVKPGDDFFAHVNGAWLARTDIPADQPSISAGRDVNDLTREQLRTLIEASAANPSSATARQIGGFYASFMNENAVEALDAKPLAADLARIAAITNKNDFTAAMARTHGAFGLSLFGLQPYADAKAPVTTLYLGQDGLGMPDRDYYLTDQFKPKKDAYVAYIVRTLKNVGYASPEAAADAILKFETRIAQASWPVADRRDVDKVYNPMTVAALQTYAPEINWRAYLDAAGAKQVQNVVLAENTAVQRIARIYADTPLETLKAWETFQAASGASPFLSKRFVDSRFEFVEKALSGTPQQRPRWKRGVDFVGGTMGEPLGREYVAKHFPPKSKAMMDDLVVNLKKAMSARIDSLAWMSKDTKAQAHAKLAKMHVMVGYPSKWRDYSALKIDSADLYGNVQRSGAFEWTYQLGKVGKAVDKEEWLMTPQTVDAYNGGFENKIVFPAGILQPPFFNPNADPAVNYGAIGAIIGHEIIHGFDDQGRKIDANGSLRDWWTKDDAARFTAEADKLVAQYNTYEPVPGMKINGRLTLGENIADLGGLLLTMDAYGMSLGGKPAPVIDGLTGEQRLLMAFGQSWRGKAREDALKVQIASDPHSPRKFRVIGPTRNIDVWYDAFDVKPGQRYHLKPEDRVRVW
jgi:putative endopeptidase